MANLDNGTTWNKNLEFTHQSGKITLSTSQTYVDKNIELNYNIPGIILPKPTSGTKTFYITVPNGSTNTVTFNFTIDANGNTTIT